MGSPNEDKAILPVQTQDDTDQPSGRPSRRAYLLGIGLCLYLSLRFILLPSFSLNHHHHYHPSARKNQCEQAEPILPSSFNVSSLVQGEERRIVNWLADAVKVPTEIFDVMGEIGEDPRWEVFYDFAKYLEDAFPLVHSHLTRTRVMTHALVYEWVGSDPSLKPFLLTGHQDVVPVLNATRGLWTHDPYGGFYDEETDILWGRGSGDDKSGTIGILSAVELLLQSEKFRPARTVILAFGIDEETGGKVGAHALGLWLEHKYGKDSMAMLVDEGTGTKEVWGKLYATPAVGEKGYLDVEIRVVTAGGHSSVPPQHTGIGYLALIIAALEKHPHEPLLRSDSPLVNLLSCGAQYAADMPKRLQKSVHQVENSMASKNGKIDEKALKELEHWWVEGSYEDGTLPLGLGRAMVTTTQAVDIINGGLKINALPEDVYAVVNHRINIASSVAELQDHLIHVLSPVVKRYNLSLEGFGEDVQLHGCHLTEAKKGKVVLSEAFNSSLDPAPISPFTVESPAWRVLSGTTKGVYKTRPGAQKEGDEIYMAPSTSTGNTDTKRYWDLTKNIYRFSYLGSKDEANAHTVNEHIRGTGFVELTRWFMNLIVNMDEARDL